MKIGDKVYIRERTAAGLSTGVIVAKKYIFNPWPEARYVVKKVQATDGIVGVIAAAFYGPQAELLYCDNSDLIRVPDIANETTADSNPKNEALGTK